MIIDPSYWLGLQDLRSWFVNYSAPFWRQHGVDSVYGGFFERLNISSPYTATDEPRRARLVARQIYFFAVAESLGWDGPADFLISHGFDFLNQYLISSSGHVSASCTPSGKIIDNRQHLYDVAFVLLALARQATRVSDPSEYEERAYQITKHLISNPNGGYIDEINPEIQCSNPHMHLLEAFLAWTSASSFYHDFWTDRAGQLAQLATNRMIQPEMGVLPEYFDNRWTPIKTQGYYRFEPGHQYEWSWLLARWSSLNINHNVASLAFRMCNIAETYGIDSSTNHVVDCFDQDFVVRSRTSRLWQQTERIKAWHYQAIQNRNYACGSYLNLSLSSLTDFLNGAPIGLWHDEISPDGTDQKSPIKASSGYHIACALDFLVTSLN